MVKTGATNHAHAAHGLTLHHGVACDHLGLLLSWDNSIIRDGAGKCYRKGIQTSLARSKSFWQKICQISAFSRTSAHEVVNRQHEAESQQQRRRAAAMALCRGDHVLTDDIEHSASCKGEDEGQCSGGEIYRAEA